MVDFIEAFKEGQTAAEIAKKNNREITSVFKELNEQLYKETGGKIRISLAVELLSQFMLQDTVEPIEPIIAGSSILPAIKENELSHKTEKYKLIYAENPSVRYSPKKELVKWEQGREGYPCKITIGNKQHYCEDKTELENTLALMLQDPIVAETLTNLMSLSQNKTITR